MIELRDVENWADGLEELHERICMSASPHASPALSNEVVCWHI